MTDIELRHYGVKGMRWGVKKANSPNANYSKNQRNYDLSKKGKGSVKRINKRMNKGADLKTARNKEVSYKRKRAAVAVAAVRYGPRVARGAKVVGGLALGMAAQQIAVKAETNRGRSSAANTMGLPRKASSGPSYSKKKNGAYNITSM